MNVPAPQSSRHPQPGDILFDLGIFFVSGALLWLWAQDSIFRVGSEGMLLVFNALIVYSIHRYPQQSKMGYALLGASFLSGIVALILGMLIQPLWWRFAVLFLGGHQQSALILVDRHPGMQGTLVLAGLLAVYYSIVLFVRLTLTRLEVIPEPYFFAWVRRREKSLSA